MMYKVYVQGVINTKVENYDKKLSRKWIMVDTYSSFKNEWEILDK